ncbi:MAG: hypothetical protein ACLQBB_00150 [Solirubrobacteraceae bacterium]
MAAGITRHAGSALPALAAGIAAAVPVISSAQRALRAGWAPAGDDGIIATRAWDVLTAHTPLVGQYSEAGLALGGQAVHSPGPMLYWLLALPARYGSIASLALTMAALNTAAIVTCVVLARRRGGLVLMFAVATAIALMCQSLPAEALHDVWNPAAGLFPFLALVFLGWSLACGEYRLLPVTALVASFVTQTHLMYLLPSLVVLLVGCGGLALRSLGRRRAKETGVRVWPWVLAAVAVAAGCWAMPAIDELESNPGNLTLILRTAQHGGPTLGREAGVNAVVRAVGVPPWWLHVPGSEWQRKLDVLTTPGSDQLESAAAILLALALAALISAAARRWDLTAAALIGLGLCAAIGLQAGFNPSRPLLAETLGYTLWWGSEVGLWVWVTLVWALWLAGRVAFRAGGALLGPRLFPARRVAVAQTSLLRSAGRPLGLLLALAAVAVTGAAVSATARPDSHVYEYRPVGQLASDVTRAIPPDATVGYRLGPLDTGTQPMEPTLRYLLVRHGDRVLANGSLPRLGSYYEQYHRPVQWILYLVDGAAPVPRMRLVGRVGFTGPWGREILSAWARRVAR